MGGRMEPDLTPSKMPHFCQKKKSICDSNFELCIKAEIFIMYNRTNKSRHEQNGKKISRQGKDLYH